jgi:hypothetical protein
MVDNIDLNDQTQINNPDYNTSPNDNYSKFMKIIIYATIVVVIIILIIAIFFILKDEMKPKNPILNIRNSTIKIEEDNLISCTMQKEISENCKLIYSSNDIVEKCLGLTNIRDECYIKAALSKNNPQICERVINEELKQMCKGEVITSRKN